MVMTGVRSFDIKAYDNSLARLRGPGLGRRSSFQAASRSLQYLNQTPTPTTFGAPSQSFDTLSQTFAHEGRMPPLQADLRYDAQFGAVPTAITVRDLPTTTATSATTTRRSSACGGSGILGPPSTAGRRGRGWKRKATGFPAGPPFAPPIYPSFRRPTRRRCGASDPDPRDRPGQSKRQDIDHPSGFHGQAVTMVASDSDFPLRREGRGGRGGGGGQGG